MYVRTFVAMVVVSLAAALPGAAHAAEPVRCSLGDKYPIRSVGPFVTMENAGYTSYNELRGAEVIVPAQPGLTREWLQRVVSYQVAEGVCDFGERNVAVSVLPAGAAFSVRISGTNQQAAQEILRHAQQLVGK
jgi:hypothetical protein